MKYTLVIIALILVGTSEALIHTKKTFNHTAWGDQTFYYEYLPQGYGNGTKFPALIFLHGAGENANGPCTLTTLTKVTQNGGTPPYYIQNNIWPLDLPFIVISPQAPWGHGVENVEIAVRIIKEAYTANADLNRIYITGLSQGGGAVWNFLAANVNNGLNVAAAVPICAAATPSSSSQYTTIASASVPIWTFHAWNDGSVNITTTTIAWVNGLNAAGLTPTIKFTNFSSGGHGIWQHVYETNKTVNVNNYIYSWLLGYSRGSTGSTTSTTGPATTVSTTSTTSTTGPASTTSTTGSGSTTSSSTTGSNCPAVEPQTVTMFGNCTCTCH
ncbi:hypothetical protein DLAC_11785 [Tieghemostelium lacteum]|uniref:Phospholipase/carboxylesterase/thioesterase domain-containing protein n=1 Tax=Tieghemostelium lacteum TaxID=361077 RepID=A0A151Z722_TIELA|nr:hypothetical protein DLAC_11785 [Tieghemostelium lacteum]|eukprot:KYQ89759.1 hypothetical protein DLAC_11785 [Tieghemostelium lacteum]